MERRKKKKKKVHGDGKKRKSRIKLKRQKIKWNRRVESRRGGTGKEDQIESGPHDGSHQQPTFVITGFWILLKCPCKKDNFLTGRFSYWAWAIINWAVNLLITIARSTVEIAYRDPYSRTVPNYKITPTIFFITPHVYVLTPSLLEISKASIVTSECFRSSTFFFFLYPRVGKRKSEREWEGRKRRRKIK